MELASSYSSSSSSDGGLKFGKKIYFEDVGLAGNGPSLPPPPAKKGRSAAAQGGSPARCQVEGCNADLSQVKAYYSKHKVCALHSKSPMVIVAGIEQRFCQQCSRFHKLSEFDQVKRSCRRRLAGHNERRRKPHLGSILSTCYDNRSSSPFGNNGKNRSFLMDFTSYPWRSSTRVPEQAWNGQMTASGKFLEPPKLLLPGSDARAAYLSPSVARGESVGEVSDSTRALSLLSNQPWGLGNHQSGPGVNIMLNADRTHDVCPSSSHVTVAAIEDFSSPWGFKHNQATASYSGDLEYSADYDSSAVHWTL